MQNTSGFIRIIVCFLSGFQPIDIRYKENIIHSRLVLTRRKYTSGVLIFLKLIAFNTPQEAKARIQ
jgi:hypothetical protein